MLRCGDIAPRLVEQTISHRRVVGLGTRSSVRRRTTRQAPGAGMETGVVELDEGGYWRALSCRGLPRSRSFALATAMPSRVRLRIRSASNSAAIASTLKQKSPDRIRRVVGRPADAQPHIAARELADDCRAHAAARAKRSSFVTTSAWPSRQPAIASRKPGRARLVPEGGRRRSARPSRRNWRARRAAP